jgi:hypothetical protein
VLLNPRVRAGIAGVSLVVALAPATLLAQGPARPTAPPAQAVPGGRGAAQLEITSAEISADRRITLRVPSPGGPNGVPSVSERGHKEQP